MFSNFWKVLFISVLVSSWVFSGSPQFFGFPSQPEKIKAATGDVGTWIEQNGSLIPTTSFVNMPFEGTGSENRNDGIYTYNSGTDDITVSEAGNYLVIYNIETNDDSNGRYNLQSLVAVNGSALSGSYGAGYSRNNNNRYAYANGAALALNVSANDEISVQWRRDTDTPTGGSIAGASSVSIIRLPDDSGAAYGHYGTPTSSSFTGQTWTDLTGLDVIRETDTNSIELQPGGNDIRLKNSGSVYLIIYGLPFKTGGSRTQRIGRAVSGATEIEQSASYTYIRNTANEYGALYSMFLYKTTSANEDISIQAQRGQADVDGSAVMMNGSGEAGVFVMELPSSAESFISVDGTGAQDVSAASSLVDLNLMRSVDHNDSASFTKESDTSMQVEQAMDVLLTASCLLYRPSGATNKRLTVGARFEIEGIDQTIGGHGTYVRGDQSTTDTYNGSFNPAGIFSVSTNDSVQIEAFDNGDDGADDQTKGGSCGFGALNLDSLFGGGGNSLPVASSVLIDSGASSVTLTEDTTTTVSCVATVTDNDGYADISSVTADLYNTSQGSGSSLDDNNHYRLSGDSNCVPSGGSGNTETYTCDFDVQYFAEPTDTGSPDEGDNWTCLVTPSDGAGAGTTASDTIEMDSLFAIGVTSSINYGTVDPNTDTNSTNQTTTVTNTGNRSLDVQLSGTDMTSGGDTILVGNQEYSATSFTYGAGTSLSSTPTTITLTLPKPTSVTPVTDDVLWGLGVDNGQPAGTYTGTNTFGAISG